MNVLFYSRPNCPLCDEGLTLLKLVQEEGDFEIVVKNIEEDDELHEKYMLKIPVVEKDGVEIQSGMLDFVTLYESLI